MSVVRYYLQHSYRFSLKLWYPLSFRAYATYGYRNKTRSTHRRPIFNRLSVTYSTHQDVYDVSYEDLSVKLKSGAVCLIDVREPGELASDGFIEESIPIPLATLQTALNYSNEEFMEMYGVDKPKSGEQIVFMCRAGVRSKQAMKIASSAGYSNVRHYAEGWKGWKIR